MLDRHLVLAQVGCGYWGPNLLRAFAGQPAAAVKWVAEVRPERRDYVRASFPQCRVTDSWRAVLEDEEVDAVVVATPAATHHGIVREALLRGKHVLVEKPLATTVVHARELADLAATRGRLLVTGHTFLYNAAVRRMRELIAGGEIGDVYYVYSQRLNLGQTRSDVNVWWNLAPHDVSILAFLLGGAVAQSVSAQGVTFLQPGIEDVAFAVLRFPAGVTAHVHVSWLDPGKVRKVTVVGSRKMLVYDDLADHRLAIYDRGIDRVPTLGERMDFDDYHGHQLLRRMGDVVLPRIDVEEPLRVEAAHFLDCIRNGAAPLSGPRHACEVVAVLEAGERSLRAGGAQVPVDPV
jgi:predicted dehydrogenase